MSTLYYGGSDPREPVARKSAKNMGRSLRAYLAYYDERFENAFLVDPETVFLAKKDYDSGFFETPYECEEEYSVGECIGAGEQLAKILGLNLSAPGVQAVITSYILDGMGGVIGTFCRGTESTKVVVCHFFEALKRVLSEREGRECWPEISGESVEKFKKWFCSRSRTEMNSTISRFAELLLGEAGASKLCLDHFHRV